MLKFDLEAVKSQNPLLVVSACADLLSLTHCGLFAVTYSKLDLADDLIDPTSVYTGAMEITAACSELLCFLVGEDLIEGCTS